MSRKTKSQLADQQDAITYLKTQLSPGDTVYCVLRHVSRSGMMRHIDFYKMTDDGPQWLSPNVAEALDYPTSDSGALKVGGCGMDMGFHVVYTLSRTLFRDGWACIGDGDSRNRCPSNDHNNPGPDRRNYSPDHHHKDGGYALRHRWM
jgi:hypothetical protein